MGFRGFIPQGFGRFPVRVCRFLELALRSLNMRRTFSCFDLVIHGFGWDGTWDCIQANLKEAARPGLSGQPQEILLAAQWEVSYWETLRWADLRLVDGIPGLSWPGIASGAWPKRYAGVALAEDLAAKAVSMGWTVGLIGGGSGYCREGRQGITFPVSAPADRRAARRASGHGWDGNGEPGRPDALVAAQPDILLVALGIRARGGGSSNIASCSRACASSWALAGHSTSGPARPPERQAVARRGDGVAVRLFQAPKACAADRGCHMAVSVGVGEVEGGQIKPRLLGRACGITRQ